MNIKTYTDEQYVPLSELGMLGEDFVQATKEYREQFVEVIKVDDLSFANVVETPSLVKKRFIKNIELKDSFKFDTKDHDYILELAKEVVRGNYPNNLDAKELEKLNDLFLKNNKDLTIITNYLISKAESLLRNKTDEPSGAIEQIYPELNKQDVKFLKKHCNLKLNYSIKNYQEQIKTSYETARKAFEKFKNYNLYEKTKVGKKFIYKPTEKLSQLVKGGE